MNSKIDRDRNPLLYKKLISFQRKSGKRVKRKEKRDNTHHRLMHLQQMFFQPIESMSKEKYKSDGRPIAINYGYIEDFIHVEILVSFSWQPERKYQPIPKISSNN
jgi:hypothetical protein